MDCIFCAIAAGQIPATKVYEDELVCAFLDNAPQAPVHILIVPREHIPSALEIDAGNSGVVAHIFEVAARVAKEQGVAEDGYRILTNIGKNGGQTVQHLHFHLLGGRGLSTQMG